MDESQEPVVMKTPDNPVNNTSRSSRVLERYMENIKEKYGECDDIVINNDVLHTINDLPTFKTIESNILSSIECCNERVDDGEICECNVEVPRHFVGR